MVEAIAEKDAVVTATSGAPIGDSEDLNDNIRIADSDDVGASEDKPVDATFILMTISLMLAVFIMALDTTILSTAIPSITTRFQSIDDIGWYSSAYLLPLMSLQPTFAKVYSFFSVKLVFVGAMALFEVGSLVCATAPSSIAFIMGRALSGIGSAAIYAGGMIIITSTVPLNRISIYLALLSTMWALAGLIGPPLGGVFTDSSKLTWRFCFWINLPFGALAIAAFLWTYHEPQRDPDDLTAREKLVRMDFGGTILFVASVVVLFVGLQLGGNKLSWSNARVIICFVASGLCFLAFLVLQWYMGPHATIPPHIMLNRSVMCSIMVAAMVSMGCNVHTFYQPFYFQSAKGTTASSSGLRLLPLTLSVTAAELVVGTASSFLGVFLPFMYAGTSVFTIAAALLCTLNIYSSTGRVIWNQILAGLGVGSSMQLCATSVRVAVDKKDIPIAATLSVFAPFFGSSLGASVAQALFRSALQKQLLTFLSASEAAAVIEAGGTGVEKVTTARTKLPVMNAYNDALKHVFIQAAVAGGVATVCTLGIKWRTLKSKPEVGVQEEKATGPAV